MAYLISAYFSKGLLDLVDKGGGRRDTQEINMSGRGSSGVTLQDEVGR